jgi:hypothetical protein
VPADDSLKRLGGGRWQTRDGRFAIEPQSGTWVVVDSSQTDDLGLPLVRGPFGSLTAAREAIEAARGAGPVESPLADRIRQAKEAEVDKPKTAGRPAKAGTAGKAGRAAEPAAPKPPPEPKWLRDLGPAERRQAHQLIRRLEKLDIGEPEAIARAEIARNQPALVRLAIERSVRQALASSKDPAEAVRAAVGAILSGRDSKLEVRWSLVDERGRRVDSLDISD